MICTLILLNLRIISRKNGIVSSEISSFVSILVGKMRVFASLLLIFVSTSHCLSFLEVVLTEGESWKVSNMKRYNSDTEDNFRLKIYMENKAKIDRHNKRAYTGQHSYFLKMNKYGDLLHHEFRRVMNGYKMRPVNQQLLSSYAKEPYHLRAHHPQPNCQNDAC